MITALDINSPHITGRLGNQLFVIATALAWAERHKDKAIFPHWNYGLYFKTPLPFSNHINADLFTPYTEPAFHYTPIPYRPYLHLKGHFQSESYFADQAHLVRHYFQPKTELIFPLQTQYAPLLKTAIGLHIRRGDYAKFKGYHPILPMTYYENALSFFDSKSPVLIFSDDIPWCKKAFQWLGNRAHFIQNQPDYLDLFLMSLCQHHIVANSSFSWWGAWLNPKLNKQVIAPDPWFGHKITHNTQDLIPDSWVKLTWK